MDARGSFLWLEIHLAGVPVERIEALVKEAWASRAPKTLLERYS
jgi:hypothetical protein